MISARAVNVGVSGEDFVRQYLQSNEGHELTQLLAPMNLGGGTVVAFVPDGVKLSDMDFVQSGLHGMPTGEIDTSVAAWLSIELVRRPDSVLLFEHPLADCLDSWLLASSVPYVCHDNTVFHWLDERHSSVGEIVKALRTVGAHRLIGILSSGNFRGYKRGAQIRTQDLAVLAGRTVSVLVRAFDGDGYMLWIMR